MSRLYLDLQTGRFTARTSKGAKPAADKKPAGEVAKDSQAMRKAKTLAALHGVNIEREKPGAYWVTCAGLADTPEDPCSGNHFCTDAREVLEAVQAYADHLTTTKKDTP